MTQCVVLPVHEPSQTGDARRMAIALANRLGFNETERGKVAIVVMELSSNMVRHAQGGLLLIQPLERRNVAGIELLALDKGPGMKNVSDCLRDGFSTAGTLGQGMGAVMRQSSLFQIHSIPEVGTAILCRLWASPLPPRQPQHRLQLGVICLPKPGEAVSGDAWATHQDGDRHLFLVADGLGHGILAARASQEAVRIFYERGDRSPKEILEYAHGALRSTRGAAVAIAEVNLRQQQVRFAGIGNIAAAIISANQRQNLVSLNGTVGHEVRKVQEFSYPWITGGLLVMHSDGLGTQWRIDHYAGLLSKHPSLIAGVLYRDFHRSRDDVAVLAAHEVNS